MALVPQRIMNAYKFTKLEAGLYHKGDFVLNFGGCVQNPRRHCAKEMRPIIAQMAHEKGAAAAASKHAPAVGDDKPGVA